MKFQIGKDILKGFGTAGGGFPRGRLRTVYTVFSLLFLSFVIFTLYYGIRGTDRARRGVGSDEWVVSRADIVDRNGDVLAKNIVYRDVYLYPRDIKNSKHRERAITLLHDVFPDLGINEILQLINDGKRKLLRENISDAQWKKLENIAGIEIVEKQIRKYPKRRIFAHAIGFAGSDGRGLEGAESWFNSYLSDNTDPLVLSLDARIQNAFYDELSNAMGKYRARGAMGMLMNSKTGEMIAMVNLPDFDPENRGLDPMSNRMFMPMRGLYEMGSVFKLFNTSMAIETGIGLEREYYIAKPYNVLDSRGRVAATIRDHSSFKPPRPNLSVAEILQHSCNAGSVQIALELPGGEQKDFFERMSFDRALNLEFGRTEKPMMPQKWGPVERATVSFGHGISVTPMHTMLAVNAITNGGIYIMPTLRKRDIGAVSGRRVVPANISSPLREIMYKITEEGSGKKAKFAGINIGGKTSTAEKREANGKSSRFRNMTSFVAVFPIESPQYIMMVVLDEPKGVEESFGLRTAAWNVVPTTGAILDTILPLLFN